MYRTLKGSFEPSKLSAVTLVLLLIAGLVAADYAAVQPQSEGKSAINADTVDGKHASEIRGKCNAVQ